MAKQKKDSVNVQEKTDAVKDAQPFTSVIGTVRDEKNEDGEHYFVTTEFSDLSVATYFSGQNNREDGMYPSVHVHIVDGKGYVTVFTTDNQLHTLLIGELDYNSEISQLAEESQE